MKYNEIREDLRTGDILLFSGQGFLSAGIKVVTGCKWSHVGIVLRLAEYDFVCVWESTTLSKSIDLGTEAPRSGVQLVMLSDRIAEYKGDIALRRLQGDELSQEQKGSLLSFRREVQGREYEESKLELIKSAYDGPFGGNTENLSSIFCSELVAEAYKRIGLLGDNLPSNEYTPADFSDSGELCLIDGYTLSNEIALVKEG